MIVIDPTNLLIASVYGLNGHMPSMHAVPLCTCSFGLAALKDNHLGSVFCKVMCEVSYDVVQI